MPTKHILVAHDFSEPAQRALLFATQLAQSLGANLSVVHVHPDLYDARGDASLGLPWPNASQVERYVRFLDGELERTCAAVAGDIQGIKRVVVRGDPVKRLLAVANEIGADLVCVGSTGKGAVERALLGSVSQALMRRSAIPIVTVH